MNNIEARPDGDGRLRLVVARCDPGIANWLDPRGHAEGTVVFRNYRARTSDVPNSRVVKVAELDSVLPPDTIRISARQRAATMKRRRAAMRCLYGE